MTITNLNLSELVVRNSMSLEQIKLITKCIQHCIDDEDFRVTLNDEENEEAQSMIQMFSDPNLEDTCRAEVSKLNKTHHGFCI
jgi:hypothetical protein